MIEFEKEKWLSFVNEVGRTLEFKPREDVCYRLGFSMTESENEKGEDIWSACVEFRDYETDLYAFESFFELPRGEEHSVETSVEIGDIEGVRAFLLMIGDMVYQSFVQSILDTFYGESLHDTSENPYYGLFQLHGRLLEGTVMEPVYVKPMSAGSGVLEWVIECHAKGAFLVHYAVPHTSFQFSVFVPIERVMDYDALKLPEDGLSVEDDLVEFFHKLCASIGELGLLEFDGVLERLHASVFEPYNVVGLHRVHSDL